MLVQSGMLSGGSAAAFRPLALVLRGAPFPLNTRVLQALAHQLDRASIYLDQRAMARLIFTLYIAALHVLLVL